MKTLTFKRYKDTKKEAGFTLVELLVVILIIGILAAVAIPAFMDQRRRANDAATQNDVKNVALMVETWMINNPNEQVPFNSGWMTDEVSIGTGDNKLTTKLSDGVSIVLRHPRLRSSEGTGSVWYPDPNVPPGTFEIEAIHANGKRYHANSGGERLRYRSDQGGFY